MPYSYFFLYGLDKFDTLFNFDTTTWENRWKHICKWFLGKLIVQVDKLYWWMKVNKLFVLKMLAEGNILIVWNICKNSNRIT